MSRPSRGRVVALAGILASLPLGAALASEPQAAGALAENSYACQRLLPDSARMLLAFLDPWTGLPYDQLVCGGPWAVGATGSNKASGVVAQLAYATIDRFAQDAGQVDGVKFAFVDRGPGSLEPALLYALKVDLQLSPANAFGGVVWGAVTDVRRYDRLRIRYATSGPGAAWQLKLNFTTDAGPVEPFVDLPGTPAGKWVDLTFSIARDFAGADPRRLNYITLATDLARAGAAPSLWVDQLAFLADPAQAGRCDAFCAEPLPSYPDLACYEPYTGAVNVANALTALSLLPKVGLASRAAATIKVGQILGTLAGAPGRAADGKWMQDWHSPVSGMPDPRNRVGSTTDLPQLYAALMVVERTWPEHAVRAKALRARLDFALLPEPGNPCCLRFAVDRCAGALSGCLEYIGRDSLLGSFLAVASGGAPLCHWSSLATIGCGRDGPKQAPWLTTGPPCQSSAIPATGVGGPFLQLAAPLYLDERRISWGSLTLGQSAGNMLRAQARFAKERDLDLSGWAAASDPNLCHYLGCQEFVPAKVTPYVWAMGAAFVPTLAEPALEAFHDAGVDAPVSTGTRKRAFGLRDAWNQSNDSGRDAFLYLDTGWTALGLLNACHADLVRRTFGEHELARNGYKRLRPAGPLCPAR